MKQLWPRLATLGPIGFIPRAPGTWGSLAGLLVGWLCSPERFGGEWLYPILLNGAITLLAYIAIRGTEAAWQTHDDGRIIIDEVAAQSWVICFCGVSLSSLVGGFLLFRLFDIWKPGPVGWIDQRWQSSWGTLADDLAAGVLAIATWFLGRWLLMSAGFI